MTSMQIIFDRLEAIYLYIQVIVDLDGMSKQEDVLHQTGKLPHAPQLSQGLDILRRRHLRLEQDVELGLLTGALVARHREGGGALQARMNNGTGCVNRYASVRPVVRVLRVSRIVPECEVGSAVQ